MGIRYISYLLNNLLRITKHYTSILGHVHIIIRSNNTACLNLLLKLLWNENILNIKKRNLVTNLPLPSSQSSVVYTFHPTTFFQTGVCFNTFG